MKGVAADPEIAREEAEYRLALKRLSPFKRAAWARVEEAYEWFDGEAGIAHASLMAWLKRGGK